MNGVPEGWRLTPLKAILRVRSERHHPELPLLSVYRDHGVVPFGSIEGNYNKPSLELDAYHFSCPVAYPVATGSFILPGPSGAAGVATD